MIRDGGSEIEFLCQENPAKLLRIAMDVHIRRVPPGVVHRGPSAQQNGYRQALLCRELDSGGLVFQAPSHVDLALTGRKIEYICAAEEKVLLGTPSIDGGSRKNGAAPAAKVGPGGNRPSGVRVVDGDPDSLAEGGAAGAEAKQCNRTKQRFADHITASPSTARFTSASKRGFLAAVASWRFTFTP
jgi:hypothetical protein